MKTIAGLYTTGTMLWAICRAQIAYARFHPSFASMVNFDVSQGLWLVFALPGVLIVRSLHWSPQSPMVTLASAGFWWTAWMLRKRLTRRAQPEPSVTHSAPAEIIAWHRTARTYMEED